MKVVLLGLFWMVVILAFPPKVSAHCDTLDGPVVGAARKAIKTGNVNYILVWVKAENDEKIRRALKKARKKKQEAKNKEEEDGAEMELFETLVRVHRQGEGAGYEGIKPAGSVEPEIALADKAVGTGKLDEIIKQIESKENREIIRHLFHKVKERAGYSLDDVRAGREFVESYVVFIHAVEKAIRGELLEKGELHKH